MFRHFGMPFLTVIQNFVIKRYTWFDIYYSNRCASYSIVIIVFNLVPLSLSI
jgi:hypothetical protein